MDDLIRCVALLPLLRKDGFVLQGLLGVEELGDGGLVELREQLVRVTPRVRDSVVNDLSELKPRDAVLCEHLLHGILHILFACCFENCSRNLVLYCVGQFALRVCLRHTVLQRLHLLRNSLSHCLGHITIVGNQFLNCCLELVNIVLHIRRLEFVNQITQSTCSLCALLAERIS